MAESHRHHVKQWKSDPKEHMLEDSTTIKFEIKVKLLCEVRSPEC